MIYNQLAAGYSTIEFADFFESASMRLIALGFAELGYYRMCRAARNLKYGKRKEKRRVVQRRAKNRKMNDGSIPSDEHRASNSRQDGTEDDDDSSTATEVSITRDVSMN